MSNVTMNIPANANVSTALSEDVGGTGVSNVLGNTLTVNVGPVAFTANSSSGSAVTLPASGTLVTSTQLVANIKFLEHAFAGGASSVAITIAGLTSSSIAIPGLKSYTSPQTIVGWSCAANTLNVLFSADPGASLIDIVVAIAPQ